MNREALLNWAMAICAGVLIILWVWPEKTVSEEAQDSTTEGIAGIDDIDEYDIWKYNKPDVRIEGYQWNGQMPLIYSNGNDAIINGE